MRPGRVAFERFQFRERRGQAGQVERHATEQDPPLGFGRGREALALEPGQDEGVDRVANPPHSFDRGIGGRCGDMNAQCGCHLRPSAIQRRIVSVWAGERTLPDFGGGIRSSRSWAVIRR